MPGAKKTLALLCSLEGIITEVIRDDFGLSPRVKPGRPLTLLFEKDSFSKASRFMSTLVEEKTAANWELTVRVDNTLSPLHFCGGVRENELLIIGAGTSSNAIRMLNGLMRISNEQANALRASLKETALLRDAPERDAAMYDELSRLNNELANLQRQLSKQNIELKRLNELKNQFLGMAAHDLHHPLYAIQMYSEFIMDEAADTLSPTHREFLEIIQLSSETMRQMIADYLDIAAIEAGELTLQRERVDVVERVRGIVNRQALLAEKKGTPLRLSVPETPVIVDCDPAKFEQVVSNLISNAVKYTASDAAVDITLTAQPAAVVLSVKDRGIGIAASKMGKLFEPFQRLSAVVPKKEKSSGLGLAIVKKIIDGHGWRIDVDSEEGVGSTFSVTIPIPPAAE